MKDAFKKKKNEITVAKERESGKKKKNIDLKDTVSPFLILLLLLL